MRKEIDVTIDAENRDKGKVFHIKEMPATQSEEWGIRALLALSNSGVQIPDEVRGLGFEGIAIMGLKAFGGIKWADAKPLLAEMMTCVTRVEDPKGKPNFTRKLVEDDTEEPSTLLRLRGEVLALHMGFSLTDVLLKLQEAASSAASRNTPTSQES